MYKHIRNHQKTTICIVILVQLVIIASYIYMQSENHTKSISMISFIEEHYEQPTWTYHTLHGAGIHLKTRKTRQHYVDFNSSLCYANGTDLKAMRSKWQCKCLPRWHGKDCGQPEVVMRAFLTYKKRILVTGPRVYQRRVIYVFSVDKFNKIITGMRVQELADVVDLFVFEERHGNFTQQLLRNNYLKKFQRKILYVKDNTECLGAIRNLHKDDIVLYSNEGEIPNKNVIRFLKNYDNWPEPLRFRLRWSVYGFFWLNPSKTLTTGGLATVSHFGKVYNWNWTALGGNKTNNGLIMGDLNHFGGWLCQFCMDSTVILQHLTETKGIDLLKLHRKQIDTSLIEDWIENGLYIDGRTELLRARKYRDRYFAPQYVLRNEWKYDFLMMNIYTQLDYYEG